MPKKKDKDSWPKKSADEIIEDVGEVASMVKEQLTCEPAPKEALSVREFIKLLRADKTLEELDRLKVYVDGKPITSVAECDGKIIISYDGD